MRRFFSPHKPGSISTPDAKAAPAGQTEPAGPPPRRGRRGLLGMMKTAGLGIAAATGATALFQQGDKTAYASSPGNFSSSSSGTPAVKATGTHGARGVQGTSDSGYGVYGSSFSTGGVHGSSTNGSGMSGTSANSNGVIGTSTNSNGLYGTSTNGFGIYGISSGAQGIYGKSTKAASRDMNSIGVQGMGNDVGVYGSPSSADAIGVLGITINGPGVSGISGPGAGVSGRSVGGIGVSAQTSSPTAAALSAQAGLDAFNAPGLAGQFHGNVTVSGSISKGGGSFLIDHPLDSANKSLYHSFVESPDMKNIYDGVTTLDDNGEVVVTLPDWFGALNSDFRYQLTCLGGYAPVYIAQKIDNNQFKIAGGQAGMEVSWMVTGIRQDAWAQKYRIPVEVEKSVNQLGLYHHPELFGQSEEKSLYNLL